MKDKIDLEEELAKRMAGEVYPELVRLIVKNKIASIAISSADVNDLNYERVKTRFYIGFDGLIVDDMALNDDDCEYGESDDVSDEPSRTSFDISNAEICPVFKNCKHLCYKYYCEQVLEALEMLLIREGRIYDILKKIDRIPAKREVLIEKIKLYGR